MPTRFHRCLRGFSALLILSVLCGALVACEDEPPETPAATRPTARPRPTAQPAPSEEPAVAPEDQTWLVMMYQDADDEVLEQDMFIDLNEAERVGSTDRVQLVAQLDRYKGAFKGDGNWTTAKRFHLTQDDNLDKIASEEVADLGEVNMADGETLVDFATWAIETYPADKYVLILSDHGAGWPGGWNDPAPESAGPDDLPLAESFGDMLYLSEIDDALGRIREQTGIEQFEIIGFDACLMGQLEVFSAVAPHGRYAIASQEVEPALGWAYTAFLGQLAETPEMDGAELSRVIVDSYIEQDERLIDDRARARYVQQSYEFDGEVSAEEIVEEESLSITLTAVDLAQIPALMDALDEMIVAMAEVDQDEVAEARAYSQAFESVFEQDEPESYIDLGHFAELLKEESSNEVAIAADELLAAIDGAIVAEKHGDERPGATGVAIYFPNSELYEQPDSGYESYTAVANRFAGESRWDDFLTFHYTGQPLEDSNDGPQPGADISAPGASPLTFTPLTLSAEEIASDESVTMQTEISGDHLSYVYLFVGYYDEADNSIWVADMDYIDAEQTKEVGGVFYPDWEAGSVPIDFEWTPTLYALNDGESSELALFEPYEYGASPEKASYAVDGIYTFADTGETRHARLIFSEGELTQVLGYSGEDGGGALREITPLDGDQFMVLEQWIQLGEDEDDEAEFVTREGTTFTFGDQNFTWEETTAIEGNYVIGLIAEDLDGNTYEEYGSVTVQP
jgi:hypothetical protein